MTLWSKGLCGVDARAMVEACGPLASRWVKNADPIALVTTAPSFLAGASTAEAITRDFHARTLHVPEAGCLVLKEAFAYDYGLVIKDDLLLLDKTISVRAEDLGGSGYFTDVKASEDGLFEIRPPRVHETTLKKAILVGRRGDTVHGHWLLEAMPRFLAAARHAPRDAKVIVSGHIAVYQVEMLAALGAPQDMLYRLLPGEAVRCEELWAPSVAHSNELWLHPYANDTFRTLIRAVGLDPASVRATEKLFVTRGSRRNDPRSLVNCADLEQIARRAGYRIVDPGVIGWRDQVDLFARASKVIGLSGSGLHNTTFTGSDAHVCVLQPNQNNNFLQNSIATIRGHRLSYLTGESLSAFDRRTWETPYVIDAGLFELFVDSLL